MAKEYKLEVQRNGISAILYYHDDKTLELTDPDSGQHIDYLQIKLSLTAQIINWMKTYGVSSLECTKVVV